ncbi:MAG: FAD-dependent oxidoreductase [Burkholderiales bacterium]|nr:FAD-dependent oxidoreductase [Burkholderiales bacterium]
MGQGRALSAQGTTRRALLAAGAAATLAGCERSDALPLPPGGWVGANWERGHRVRDAAAASSPTADLRRAAWPTPARRVAVLVAGSGIAGLAAARSFARRGVDDVHVLELDDAAGGNARGHVMAGMACPLGAHYLPLPEPESTEVAEWLHEIGLLHIEHGRTVPDERHLCHSPQERLFYEGQWIEGLLAPAAPGSTRLAQYRRFAARIDALRRGAGGTRRFALPAHRSAWDAELAALDATTFSSWLARERLDDPALLAYLDYCCRDDYGAGLEVVSAWAGVHYFASRHGFHAPGAVERERDAVFTWPEGNAWLAQRLAGPLGERLHLARSVLAVREERYGVQVLAWDERAGRAETWLADRVVLALPLHVAARVLESAPDALRTGAALLPVAPWLVANLQLDAPLLERIGAPPSWDNVIYHAAGSSTSLGYVDATHQSLLPYEGATVLTAYHALPAAARAPLLAADWRPWAERVLADLAPAHPDLRRRVRRIDLMRWGHAMAIPRPGMQRHPALLALRRTRGRVRFAHADLAGYSVFEEAFTAGCEAAG